MRVTPLYVFRREPAAGRRAEWRETSLPGDGWLAVTQADGGCWDFGLDPGMLAMDVEGSGQVQSIF